MIHVYGKYDTQKGTNGGKVVLKVGGRGVRVGWADMEDADFFVWTGQGFRFSSVSHVSEEMKSSNVMLATLLSSERPVSSAGLGLPCHKPTNYCAILVNITHNQYTLFKSSVQTDIQVGNG